MPAIAGIGRKRASGATISSTTISRNAEKIGASGVFAPAS